MKLLSAEKPLGHKTLIHYSNFLLCLWKPSTCTHLINFHLFVPELLSIAMLRCTSISKKKMIDGGQNRITFIKIHLNILEMISNRNVLVNELLIKQVRGKNRYGGHDPKILAGKL